MAKKYIILLALVFGFSLNLLKAQPQIPNAGFENWTSANAATSWSSVSLLTYYSIARSTDAHSGTYAAMLKTQSILTQTIPGICDLGTINLTTQAVGGGTPFVGRPVNFTGWYKYTPVGNDSMLIAFLLTRTVAGVKDTVGGVVFTHKTAVSSYTQFVLPIKYNVNVTGNPDTMNIVLLSSATATGGTGTTLMVDDLALDYGNGIEENSAIDYRIYPNPASDILTISTNETKKLPVTVKIYNLTGQEVYSESYKNEDSHTITLSRFKDGMYFVKISGNTINKTEKVLITHSK